MSNVFFFSKLFKTVYILPVYFNFYLATGHTTVRYFTVAVGLSARPVSAAAAVDAVINFFRSSGADIISYFLFYVPSHTSFVFRRYLYELYTCIT